MQTLDAVRIYKSDGTTQSLDVAGFITRQGVGASACLPSIALPPMPERPIAGIEIDVTCGYGDAGTDVPEPLRQAIRLLIAHWYENRGLIAVGHEVAILPQTVAALIAPYRVLAYDGAGRTRPPAHA